MGLSVIIIGVALVSKAGFGREKVLNNESGQTKKKQASGNFRQGLLLVILAGILSSGLGLAFVYGQGPIIEAVKQQGASEITVKRYCLGAGLCWWSFNKHSLCSILDDKEKILEPAFH